MLTVSEIWRFPVKSMGGERLEHADVGTNGLVGDRGWGVREPVTGTILTARREPRLLMATAQIVRGNPVITTDQGRTIETSAELATWLDRPAELVAAGTATGTFESPLDIDTETNWVSWQGPPGSFHDGLSTVSFVTAASLAGYDAARFRLNLILADATGDEPDENSFVGHDIDIGAVGLSVHKPIDRCVMVARAQPGLPADLSVLKRVIRERDNLMGVGAVVRREGVVRIGDRLTVEPPNVR